MTKSVNTKHLFLYILTLELFLFFLNITQLRFGWVFKVTQWPSQVFSFYRQDKCHCQANYSLSMKAQTIFKKWLKLRTTANNINFPSTLLVQTTDKGIYSNSGICQLELNAKTINQMVSLFLILNLQMQSLRLSARAVQSPSKLM